MYPIVSIQTDQILSDEPLGSKSKNWIVLDDNRWLFKEPRPQTGEDWAEKITAEIARVIGIDAAQVELAEINGQRGSISRSFVDKNAGCSLRHGNELFGKFLQNYECEKRYQQSAHTLDNIVTTIRKLIPIQDPADAVLKTLGSYFVFDALIGNTDRHHENWGLVVRTIKKGVLTLTSHTLPPQEIKINFRDLEIIDGAAPSYDHASSLGRELTDDRRTLILEEPWKKPESRLENYVEKKARGAVYLSPEDAHGASPIQLVRHGLLKYNQLFRPGMERVCQTPLESILATVDPVPNERMSPSAKTFAKAYLSYTHQKLNRMIA